MPNALPNSKSGGVAGAAGGCIAILLRFEYDLKLPVRKMWSAAASAARRRFGCVPDIEIRGQSEEKRRRASLAAALHKRVG